MISSKMIAFHTAIGTESSTFCNDFILPFFFLHQDITEQLRVYLHKSIDLGSTLDLSLNTNELFL